MLIQEATMHGLDAHQLAWIEYVCKRQGDPVWRRG
ncbi:hypothetical protein M2222_007858 [Bradyrhizobium elkanii]|nr:hypothetical protein [Bradyrhizobium elkanii]MCS3565536.1 hypothetical protein [Bradyrhizobium elkanii]MCW2153732.1 hypothetical protein [Bradyrhizobium elkanii]MCW2356559.1 hypothetical protein [Bradyrhizobium elkanii]MCW2377463.1 hypothetical protein [Bradyrhizobium elkanii]